MSEAPPPRILRKRDEPDYPIFVELFFDLAYIFTFLRLTGSLVADEGFPAVAQTTVLLLAVWWVWVLTAWLTGLFDPRLLIIQNLVIATAVGVIVMASAIPEAFHGRALIFVLAYFAIHLARDAVLIPGTRVNRDIQARSIRVFFWLGISAVPWLAGRSRVAWRGSCSGPWRSRSTTARRGSAGPRQDSPDQPGQPDLHRPSSGGAAPADRHRRVRRAGPDFQHRIRFQ